MLDISRIALLSTVINFDLYSKSAPLFPKGIQKYVIDGRNGMHGINSILYMMQKLKKKEIDWLIMADEDVVFTDSESVFNIIEEMKNNAILFSGVRDGGMIFHRNYNPFVPNTFFSILNFKEIKKIWNAKEMLANQYLQPEEFKDNLENLPFKFDSHSLYEPYYCFYLWLRRKSDHILFLDSEMPFSNDFISNSVLNLVGKPMLYHTWYARSYGKSQNQTERIDAIFDKISASNSDVGNIIIFKDSTFAFRSMIKKSIKRLRNKIQRRK